MSAEAPKKDKKKEKKEEEDLVNSASFRASRINSWRRKSMDTAKESSRMNWPPSRNSKILSNQPPLPWPASPNLSNSSRPTTRPSLNSLSHSRNPKRRYSSCHSARTRRLPVSAFDDFRREGSAYQSLLLAEGHQYGLHWLGPWVREQSCQRHWQGVWVEAGEQLALWWASRHGRPHRPLFRCQ